MSKDTQVGRKRSIEKCPSSRFSTRKVSSHTCKTILSPQTLETQVSYPENSAAFNTLAQLAQNTSQVLPQKNFEKRARNKFITNLVLDGLLKLRTPLENSYRQTCECSTQLTEADGKITSLYCNQRWCLVCARIRTAKMIIGYMPALDKMEEKYFLTLTRKNVPASQLRSTIQGMVKAVAAIIRKLRRKDKSGRRLIDFSCLRKLECTYNEVTNEYHPHFHFIIDSDFAARTIRSMWVQYWGIDSRTGKHIADPAAQDLKPADSNSCMELFKYFTKVISKQKDKKDYRIHVAALDQMFRSMKGLRTFQPTGVIKFVSEDIEELESQETGRDIVAGWSWNGWDWKATFDTYTEVLDTETGELWNQKTEVTKNLTGYIPSDMVKEISSHIVLPLASGRFNSLQKSTQFSHDTSIGNHTKGHSDIAEHSNIQKSMARPIEHSRFCQCANCSGVSLSSVLESR